MIEKSPETDSPKQQAIAPPYNFAQNYRACLFTLQGVNPASKKDDFGAGIGFDSTTFSTPSKNNTYGINQ